jgi:hypothetical protein
MREGVATWCFPSFEACDDMRETTRATPKDYKKVSKCAAVKSFSELE